MPLQPRQREGGDQVAAFVIHARPYRETSQLVEVFSAELGRLSLIAKGSRAARSPLKGMLQPFARLSLSWRGRGDLKTLTRAEPLGLPRRLTGDRLFYGLYLNELVYYLLESGSPFPDVFEAYAEALTLLVDTPVPELPLRRFEFLLLEALGYAVDFVTAADDDSPIRTDLLYGFERELGFVARERTPDPANLFLGAHLHAFAEHRFDSPAILQAAKRFSRLALQPYLGQRRLKSRELFLKRKVSSKE
ncbi:DNA repair protein RecO [Aeromonas simiae]|uniref:DNA repair protein RecO n=1 Tax=Aeromonas simiae TaxID=218936 RepID=UPI0005A892CC|nr:DNA repair protein RecO [Aeromonas simiae]MDO2949494.1 DNA repair protein RecO [Aeromonas simiae]MDO2953158.1 DNA repair protein RecO [Aeromonas simiae]MDO2956825.1 DNA repair protein RecO [Aeromonas simiae]